MMNSKFDTKNQKYSGILHFIPKVVYIFPDYNGFGGEVMPQSGKVI